MIHQLIRLNIHRLLVNKKAVSVRAIQVYLTRWKVSRNQFFIGTLLEKQCRTLPDLNSDTVIRNRACTIKETTTPPVCEKVFERKNKVKKASANFIGVISN
jgi:hypothetical protein